MVMLGLSGSFYKDIITVLLVTVLLSSLLSLTAGSAADYYFGETISSFIGDFGEYDVIITINEDPEERGAKELEKIVKEEFPGGSFKKGIPLASQENYFLSLPDSYKRREVFKDMSRYFSHLPGYAGTSIITEPRIALRGVPSLARSFLEQELMEVEGVLFTYPIATGIDLILSSTREAPEITKRVEEILEEYQILEVNLPMGEGRRGHILTAHLKEYLEEEYNLTVGDISTSTEEDPLTLALFEMRNFLEYLGSYDGNLEEALREADTILPHLESIFAGGHTLLDEALLALDSYEDILQESRRIERLLQDGENYLYSLVGEEGEVYVNQLLMTIGLYLDTVEDFHEEVLRLEFIRESFLTAGDGLIQLESLLERGMEVSPEREERLSPLLQELRGYRLGIEDQTDELISLLNNRNPLLPILSSFEETLFSLQDLLASGRDVLGGDLFKEMKEGLSTIVTFLESNDGEELMANLQELRQDWEGLEEAEWRELISGLEILGERLPSFQEEELSMALGLLDQFLSGQALPSSDGLYLLLPSSFSLEGREEELKEILEIEEASFSSRNLGLIHPNLHVEVLRVIDQARLIIIAIMAFLFTLLALLLDQSLVMSAIRERAEWKGTPFSTWWDKIYGALCGSILLAGVMYVSGGEIPYLTTIHYLLLGGVMGLLLAFLSPKINPLDRDEMMAGISMGLSFTDLMRDIVIPMGRPGLLYLLNKRRMVFP